MADNEISILVKAEVSKAIAELKKVEQAPKSIKEQFEKQLGSAANAIKTAFLGAGAALIGGALFKGLKDITKAGLEFLDLKDDFTTVFSGIAGDAIKMRDALVNSLGLSTSETMKMLASVGNLTQSMGATTTESLRMAGNITTLATALSRYSTNGLTAEAAASTLTRAINGQERGLVELGITVTDNEKKAKGLELGYGANIATWTKAQAAQVLLAIAMDKSGKAMDGLDPKARSLADKAEIAANRFTDFKTAIGIGFTSRLGEALDKTDGLSVNMDKVARAARAVLDILIAVGGTMILAIKIPIDFTIAVIGQMVKAVDAAVKYVEDLQKKGFKGALNSGKTFIAETAKIFAEAVTAPIETIKQNALSYVEAFNSTFAAFNTGLQGATDQNNAALLNKNKTTSADVIANEEATAARKLQLWQDLQNAAIASEEAIALKRKEEINNAISGLQAYGAAFSAVGDFAMQIVQNEVDAENKGGKEKTIEQKRRLKEAAGAQKAIAIFNAVINTAAAVVAALATPFIGPALAIAAGISGAAQMALIAAKPIPEFAAGGLVTGPQAIIAGERGTEAVLPAGLTELLLNAAGAGRGGANIQIGQIVANNPEEFARQFDYMVKRNGALINT